MISHDQPDHRNRTRSDFLTTACMGNAVADTDSSEVRTLPAFAGLSGPFLRTAPNPHS